MEDFQITPFFFSSSACIFYINTSFFKCLFIQFCIEHWSSPLFCIAPPHSSHPRLCCSSFIWWTYSNGPGTPSIRPLFSLTRRSSGGFQCAFQTVTGETIASFCLCAGLFEFREREKEGAGGSSRIYIIRRRTSFDTIDGTHTFAHWLIHCNSWWP